MTVWITSMAITLVIAAIFTYTRWQSSIWRIRRISSGISKLARHKKTGVKDQHQILRSIYSLIDEAIRSRNQVMTYQAVDLLKSAFGEDVIRDDEAVRLMSVVTEAIRVKEPDMAACCLDAFRTMVWRLPARALPPAAEQLAVIGSIAMRERQYFLVTKAGDILLFLLERSDVADACAGLVVDAVQRMGILALRRRDEAMLRELRDGLIKWALQDKLGQISPRVAAVVAGWLHRIVKTGQDEMVNLLTEANLSLVHAAVFTTEAFNITVNEWQSLAGTACLDPRSKLAPLLADHLLNLSLQAQQQLYLEQAVHGVREVAKLAISRHGIAVAFPLVIVLLDAGRRLLLAELRLPEEDSDAQGFRRQSLLVILRECLMLLELAARQDITSSVGDTVDTIHTLWKEYRPEGNSKSAKKFCQLLLLYWFQVRRRQSRRSIPDEFALMNPCMLSEQEKRRLGVV